MQAPLNYCEFKNKFHLKNMTQIINVAHNTRKLFAYDYYSDSV